MRVNISYTFKDSTLGWGVNRTGHHDVELDALISNLIKVHSNILFIAVDDVPTFSMSTNELLTYLKLLR